MTSSNNLEIIGKKGSFSQFFSFKGKKEEEEERKEGRIGTNIKRLESQSHKKNIKKILTFRGGGVFSFLV